MKMFRISFYSVVNVMTIILLLYSSIAFSQTRQEHVRTMSHSVMPFEMAKTIHIFKMTESGGIERIVVRDTQYTDQVTLIRHHLEHEAKMFQSGDYADPEKLHGADMPGLSELVASASKIKISYSELTNGAQITFKTNSLQLLTAIHRWFGAQLSEHCADARAE